MKLALALKILSLATVCATNFLPFKSTNAFSFFDQVYFEEEAVNPNAFVVAASPFRRGHFLMIIEQIPGKKKCWVEYGTQPVVVEPLLLNFDFTNHCKPAVDSNNYSVRLNGQDYGSDYLLNIVERQGELKLIATHWQDNKPDILIGSTRGLGSGHLKIFLNPGWRLTRRTYNGQATDHIYLSSDSRQIGSFNQNQNSNWNQNRNQNRNLIFNQNNSTW